MLPSAPCRNISQVRAPVCAPAAFPWLGGLPPNAPAPHLTSLQCLLFSALRPDSKTQACVRHTPSLNPFLLLADEAGGVTFPDATLCRKATATRRGVKPGHTERRDGSEGPEINSRLRGRRASDEETEVMQGKASFSSERCWEDWMPPRKGLQRNPHLSSHAKVGSKWIKGLNIRP